jgi:hypothetical protein
MRRGLSRPDSAGKLYSAGKLCRALAAVALLSVAAQRGSLAQEPDVAAHRFEAGAQLTFIGINFPDRLSTSPPATGPSLTTPGEEVTTAGFGGRFGYNAYKHVAFEAEVSVLPARNINEVFQSRRTQIFAGLRAGRRWNGFGLFAKARPGAMIFDEYGARGPCTVTPPGAQDCFDDRRAFFAADVGGVVELYPTDRTIFRIDAGDTIVAFRDAGPITFPPLGSSPGAALFTRRETTHNFQLSFGFGFRF